MEPSDYESNDEEHELYAEALALAKKFVDGSVVDGIGISDTASELNFYPSDLDDKEFLAGKIVIVSVKIVYDDDKAYY